MQHVLHVRSWKATLSVRLSVGLSCEQSAKWPSCFVEFMLKSIRTVLGVLVSQARERVCCILPFTMYDWVVWNTKHHSCSYEPFFFCIYGQCVSQVCLNSFWSHNDWSHRWLPIWRRTVTNEPHTRASLGLSVAAWATWLPRHSATCKSSSQQTRGPVGAVWCNKFILRGSVQENFSGSCCKNGHSVQSLAFRTCKVCKKYILSGHRLYAANSPKEIPRKPDTSVSSLLTIPYSRLSIRCEMQAVCPCSLLKIKAFTKTALTIVSSHTNRKIAQPRHQARKVTHCIKIALVNSKFTSSTSNCQALWKACKMPLFAP